MNNDDSDEETEQSSDHDASGLLGMSAAVQQRTFGPTASSGSSSSFPPPGLHQAPTIAAAPHLGSMGNVTAAQAFQLLRSLAPRDMAASAFTSQAQGQPNRFPLNGSSQQAPLGGTQEQAVLIARALASQQHLQGQHQPAPRIPSLPADVSLLLQRAAAQPGVAALPPPQQLIPLLASQRAANLAVHTTGNAGTTVAANPVVGGTPNAAFLAAFSAHLNQVRAAAIPAPLMGLNVSQGSSIRTAVTDNKSGTGTTSGNSVEAQGRSSTSEGASSGGDPSGGSSGRDSRQIRGEISSTTPASGTVSSEVSVIAKKRRIYRHECFPERLYRILVEAEQNGKSHIISFTSSGQAFRIHRPDDMPKEILQHYFRHNQLSSFLRQARMYGFRKLASGTDKGAYCHHQFLRGQPELCKEIKRVSELQVVMKKGGK